MSAETLWSEFLARLLLGVTLAGPVPPPPPAPEAAAETVRSAAPEPDRGEEG